MLGNYNPREKSRDTKQVVPSLTFNVDNQVIFPFLLEKSNFFQNCLGDGGGGEGRGGDRRYVIQLKSRGVLPQILDRGVP